MWIESGGKMMLIDIAAALDISSDQVRQWKRKDRWADKIDLSNNHVTNESVINHTEEVEPSQPEAKKNSGRFQPGNRASVGHGPPKGSRNAAGPRSGDPYKGNNNATKHGFRKMVFPDDEETHAILNEIQTLSPLDILWDQIQIQYLAIARAQKIMWVRDQEDRTEVLKRERRGKNPEKEWELQHAWDKQATFLQAQSRAMQTLERLIARYEELLIKDLDVEEQQLKIEKLKAELEKIKNPNPEADLKSYLDALKTTAEEVWPNEEPEDKEEVPEGEADDK